MKDIARYSTATTHRRHHLMIDYSLLCIAAANTVFPLILFHIKYKCKQNIFKNTYYLVSFCPSCLSWSTSSSSVGQFVELPIYSDIIWQFWYNIFGCYSHIYKVRPDSKHCRCFCLSPMS